MRKKKFSYTDLYIKNLKEMKEQYEAKGDVFSARKTAELIALQESKNAQK